MKKIICLSAFAAIMVAGFSDNSSAKTANQKTEQPNKVILLQDFPINSEVYFTILSGTRVLLEGVKKTDDNGSLTLNIDAKTDALNTNLVYDFKIAKDGNYLDILMRQDNVTGKISASGRGLEHFSDINILSSGSQLMTKADWSGAFFEKDIFINNKEAGQTFEIALHGFAGLGNLANNNTPLVIKVLSAPGGGLLSDTPNQPPGLTAPSSGIYPMSTGNAGNLSTLSTQIVQTFITSMMLITEQLSAVMMQQVAIIGQFFDAKIQMETQRRHQELTAQAVKDYHPSEQMCRVGSYVRSLAKTDQRVTSNKYAMNDIMMTRYRNEAYSSGSIDISNDISARLRQFREIYCNPKDNNSSILYLCEHDQNKDESDSTQGAAPDGGIGAESGTESRINKDVNFTKTLDMPGTIDVDLIDGVEAEDEEDVIALAKHLYWPTVINFGPEDELNRKPESVLDLQRATALKNIAHTSYSNLVALKARAETPPSGGSTVEPGWTFMKTLMRDFGVSDTEIESMIGVQPSYWAQMDVLTKKMYQLPSFYTNLYDKPANVDRISVALDAIKLMQMRDSYNTQLRYEMLNSGLLETELVAGSHYDRPEAGLLFRK